MRGLHCTQAHGLPLWAAVTLASALIPLSALFSGLTLGLCALDNFTLQIIEKAGELDEQEYARKIIPGEPCRSWFVVAPQAPLA